jgi:hypothetical protein
MLIDADALTWLDTKVKLFGFGYAQLFVGGSPMIDIVAAEPGAPVD